MTEPAAPQNPETPAASRRRGQGERADINLGHACNNRCVFCMQGHSNAAQRRWLPLEELRAELDYYADELGVRSLGLLGGEPTLYPWLFPALDYARAKGFSTITINTNGYKLADESFCREAAARGINRYCLSVHSHLTEVEDFLSGRDGSLATKNAAIDHLLALQGAGIVSSIGFNAVLTRRNLPTLVEYVEHFAARGVRDIRFNVVRPEGRAADQLDLVPRYREIMPVLLRAALANERRWRIALSFGEIPYCVYPPAFFAKPTWRSRYIGEYRDLRTCVSSFNNPGDDDRSERGRQRFVWQDLKMDVLKTAAPACEACAWLPVCGGVWTNYLAMYGDGEFRPLAE